jgi:hypothetical protein
MTALRILPALALIACTSDVGSGVQTLTVAQLEDRLATGPEIIEIKLFDGSLAASEVHVESEIGHEDYVESRATAADAAAGTITLAFDGVVATVPASARLRSDAESQLERTAFFAQLESEIAAGTAFVRVVTDDLGNATDLVATEVRIEDQIEETKLEARLDSSNFDAAPALRVLGRSIAIDEARIEDHESDDSGRDSPSDLSGETDDSGRDSPSDL